LSSRIGIQARTSCRRFNLILTEDDSDRIVAEWLNYQANASEAIKALIYAIATGETLEVPVSWTEALDHDDPPCRHSGHCRHLIERLSLPCPEAKVTHQVSR
jgi:hypothetical protein